MPHTPADLFQTDKFNFSAFPPATPKNRLCGVYLYQRGNLYYFRYAFPSAIKARLGYSELRVSLKTGYIREAKRLAAVLAGDLKMTLSGDFMLTYQEIRARMHRLLQDLLLRDGQQLGSRAINFPELDLEITPAELHASIINLYKRTMADESLLLALADRCIPRLIEKGVFAEEEVTGENRLVIAKAFGEMEITFHDILRKKDEGDFLAEAQVLSSLPPFATPAAEVAGVADKYPTVSYSQAMEKYIQDQCCPAKVR